MKAALLVYVCVCVCAFLPGTQRWSSLGKTWAHVWFGCCTPAGPLTSHSSTICVTGNGKVTLQRLLKSYEQVLPRYNVRPDEDIYYYRFLLKLSLDPNPDWWAKLQQEMDARQRWVGLR